MRDLYSCVPGAAPRTTVPPSTSLATVEPALFHEGSSVSGQDTTTRPITNTNPPTLSINAVARQAAVKWVRSLPASTPKGAGAAECRATQRSADQTNPSTRECSSDGDHVRAAADARAGVAAACGVRCARCRRGACARVAAAAYGPSSCGTMPCWITRTSVPRLALLLILVRKGNC